MATGGRQGPDQAGAEPSGATEPITLTDPDGAVTRVAPWSSWTREQVRAPGGEPALVTRLDQGQLWFSAGRKRSPWRHEVHVGPAVVSTPRGRFQAVAEPDGGATISCLAGRTRVVAGLREPVLLGPEQSAAVSSDGRTLVVMDRASGLPIEGQELPEAAAAGTPPSPAPTVATAPDPASEPVVEAVVEPAPEPEAPSTDDAGEPVIDLRTPLVPSAAPEVSAGRRASDAPGDVGVRAVPTDAAVAAGPDPAPAVAEDDEPIELRPDRSRLGWLPELAAVAALVGLLIAAVLVFGRTDADDETTAPPTTEVSVTVTTSGATSTTELRTTTSTAPETTTTAATVPETVPETVPTTATPALSGAFGVGSLSGCRRAEGGVRGSARVEHRSGPASRFTVRLGLVDPEGTVFAQAETTSGVISPGGSAVVDVLVPVQGTVRGACELLDVTGVE